MFLLFNPPSPQVCCIRENPQPVQFSLSCIGVRPEVELDKKVLQFDRVLIHRKDTRSLFIRNSTMLPVAWRVNGMENLGDDFSLSSDHGVIEPRQECEVKLHFRAVKVINVKKNIRIEVCTVKLRFAFHLNHHYICVISIFL